MFGSRNPNGDKTSLYPSEVSSPGGEAAFTEIYHELRVQRGKFSMTEEEGKDRCGRLSGW